MNVTIDLAKKHLQDMPENNDVLKADLIKVIEVAEQLEQQLKNCNLQSVNGWLFVSGNERLFSSSAKQNCLCRFDDGTECYYNDEHPMAILTQFKPI